MHMILALLLLTGTTDTQSIQSQGPGASYHTAKSLPALEQCLTERLSARGDVTAVEIDGMKTIMFREGTGPAMVIDIAPPAVTVTTRFVVGTRRLVESCL